MLILAALCAPAYSQNCETFALNPATFPFGQIVNGSSMVTTTLPDGTVSVSTQTASHQIFCGNPMGRASAAIANADAKPYFTACDGVFPLLNQTATLSFGGIFTGPTTVTSGG